MENNVVVRKTGTSPCRTGLVILIVLLNVNPVSGRGFDTNEFTGPAFERLSDQERELLSEYLANISLYRQANQSFRLRANQTIARLDSTGESLQEEQRIEAEVLRMDEHFFRTTRTRGGEGKASSVQMLLINKSDLWNLKQDQNTGKFFIAEHGKVQLGSTVDRAAEWWADSPYTVFKFLYLADCLLTDNPTCRLKSVRPIVDETGERLIEIHAERMPRADLKRPGDERHPMPSLVVQLYRDHYCILKEAERRDFSIGTTTQVRTTQQCEYLLNAKTLPVLRAVIVTDETRDLSQSENEDAWTTVYRERTEIEELRLEKPDESEFRIEKFIEPANRLTAPGTDRLKWFFGLNGLVLLALWYLLSRRKRKPSNLQSIA